MTNKSSAAALLLAQPTQPARNPTAHGKQAEFDHKVIKRRIEKAGYEVFRVTVLSDGTGNQYWLLGGGVVTVYNTGTVVPGGKLTETEMARIKRKLRGRFK